MKYRVTGAMLETGRDVQVTVDARTPIEAQEIAREMGIAVCELEIDASRGIPPTEPSHAELAPPSTTASPPATKMLKTGILACALGMLSSIAGCFIGAAAPDDSAAGLVIQVVSTLLFFGCLIGWAIFRVFLWWTKD